MYLNLCHPTTQCRTSVNWYNKQKQVWGNNQNYPIEPEDHLQYDKAYLNIVQNSLATP
jgi:hypothetical protein